MLPRMTAPSGAAIALGLGLAGLTGCVSQSTYELARTETQNAQLRYQQEAQRTQALMEQVKQMKLQIEELETKLQNAEEASDRATRDYKQVRDELVAMKISQEKEQQRAKTRLKQTMKQLDQERAILGAQQDLSTKYENASPETKERVKELLRQLDELLPQSAPR